MIVRAAKQSEIEHICNKIEFVYHGAHRGVMIEDENGGIGAMAIYDRWTNSAVEMHAYSAGAKYVFRPEFCRAMFDYPFNQGKKKLAFAVTPCDNIASITLARWLGFREVYRILDGWDLGTDMVIQEIRRENCRFLEQNHRIQDGKSAKEN